MEVGIGPRGTGVGTGSASGRVFCQFISGTLQVGGRVIAKSWLANFLGFFVDISVGITVTVGGRLPRCIVAVVAVFKVYAPPKIRVHMSTNVPL